MSGIPKIDASAGKSPQCPQSKFLVRRSNCAVAPGHRGDAFVAMNLEIKQ
jgi:hypothetical protein